MLIPTIAIAIDIHEDEQQDHDVHQTCGFLSITFVITLQFPCEFYVTAIPRPSMESQLLYTDLILSNQ